MTTLVSALAVPLFRLLRETPTWRLAANAVVLALLLLVAGTMGLALKHGAELMGYLEALRQPDAGELRAELDRSADISVLLDRVLADTNAQRSIVFEYHDGRRALGGTHLLFQSGRYERFADGFGPVLRHVQSVPLSIIAGLEEIAQGRCVVNRTDVSPEYESAAAKFGAVLIAKCPLRNPYRKGRPTVGSVNLSYYRGGEVPPEDLDRLRETAGAIGAALYRAVP